MKITYLFGAGASAEALPIVNQIPKRMEDIITLLKQLEYQLSETEKFERQKRTKREVQNILIRDLEWLLDKSKNHASIDTFAKKLFLKGNSAELDILKVSFSTYLAIEQCINQVDKRYDTFFASLLRKEDVKRQLPSNIRILTWNYDSQFEIAFSEYDSIRNTSGFNTWRSILNMRAKSLISGRANDTQCSITQLNGTTLFFQRDTIRQAAVHIFTEYESTFSKKQLEKVLKYYDLVRNKKEYPPFSLGKVQPVKINDELWQNLGSEYDFQMFSGLSFAWEDYYNKDKEDPDKNIIDSAKFDTHDTEILIVIGYSFPYFNREIDREIIRNMINLRKVYFQDQYPDNIKQRFLSIRDDITNIVTINDTEQFLIPNEL